MGGVSNGLYGVSLIFFKMFFFISAEGGFEGDFGVFLRG